MTAELSTPTAAKKDNRRAQGKEANRATLLEAARRCFLQLGYDAVTIRDIVRESGLAQGTFYNYFGDKEALFREVLATSMESLSAGLHEVRASANSVEGFIHGSYLALFSKVHDEPAFFELILRNEHAVRSLFRETMFTQPLEVMRADVRDAMLRGLFPELDADLLAAAFFGIAIEFCRVLVERRSHDPEVAATFATRLLREGLRSFGVSGDRAKMDGCIAPGMTVCQT